MTKSYADQCLERADKATEGPWHTGHVNEIYPGQADIDGPECSIAEEVADWNRTFIIHARQDVPELAARVNETVEWLRRLASTLKRGLPVSYEVVQDFADELEAIPEGK